jgi:flagellar motor switch/type III secretory pathway protein FliN
MNSLCTIESTAVEVQAVLARLRMPAESLAALSLGDHLTVESEDGSGLLVRLMAAGVTIAIASIEMIEGNLIATIVNHGPAVTGTRIDQWKHSKATTTD